MNITVKCISFHGHRAQLAINFAGGQSYTRHVVRTPGKSFYTSKDGIKFFIDEGEMFTAVEFEGNVYPVHDADNHHAA